MLDFMLSKRGALCLGILSALFLFGGSAPLQAEDDIGISASINAGSSVLSMPVWIGDAFTIAPAFSGYWAGGVDTYSMGCSARKYFSEVADKVENEVFLFAAASAMYVLRAEEEDGNFPGWNASLGFGAEFFFTRSLSLGAELNLTATQLTVQHAISLSPGTVQFLDETRTTVRTFSLLNASIYF